MDHMLYIHTGQNMEELKLILDGVGVDIDIIFIYTEREREKETDRQTETQREGGVSE